MPPQSTSGLSVVPRFQAAIKIALQSNFYECLTAGSYKQFAELACSNSHVQVILITLMY